MKKAFYIAVIPLLLFVSVTAYSQSNKGTEFWTAYMSHNNGVTNPVSGAHMVLYITSDISTTGSVEIGGTLLQNFTVTANQVTFIDIPSSAYLNGFGKFGRSGIHITSANPIAVYAHIYAFNVSGATLLLPVNAMGKEYLSLNYTQISNAPRTNPAFSTFNIIATEDNTTVSITPTAQLLDGSPAGSAYTITLNKGEVYQGLALKDLTGTKIQSISTSTESCKKIAVFSGSSRIAIGCGVDSTSSSDNLFQQVYPTSTWGKNYVTTPLLSRPFDVYRIVLSDPNTSVTLNGSVISPSAFINGLYYEFKSATTNIITGDKPIQVVQYSPTQNRTIDCTLGFGDVGDPEMIYLSPVEQGLSHVTLYSTGYYRIVRSYVNVVIPTAAVGSFTLDGTSYANSFIPIPNSIYSYTQLAVTSGPQTGDNTVSLSAGTHTISASAPFNAIAYGFGSTESYGYAAGANLQDLNEFVALQDPKNPTVTQTAGCSNVAYKMQVTLPYQTTKITWKEDGATIFTDNNPTVKSSSIKDNKTFYVYEYPKAVNFTAGTHNVVATVFDPVADVCGSDQDIENDFTITNPPVVDFAVAASNCLGDSTVFTNKTDLTLIGAAKSWLWDFGDQTTSADQNPKHLYTNANDYTVRLTVTDYSGCVSVSNPKTVHVIARPVANFTISMPDCIGQTVTFNSSSSRAGEGAIKTWAWDFGDTTTSVLQNPTHTYATSGTRTVKLVVTTDGGCISDTLAKTIIVNPVPVVDFVLPDVCVNDRNSQFTSISTIADHTESEFTYLWNFGDAISGNPNTSTQKNPQHSYTATGNYTVTLSVTSKYGCTTTASKTFTVNGSDPWAAFDVLNKANLCSSDSVAFTDQSVVPNFGSITKLVWYFDYDNHPTEGVTYDRTTMRSDRTYHHFYGLNNSIGVQKKHVVLVVYSGETCFNASSPPTEIDINPNPVVTLMINNTTAFTGPLVLCQNDDAVTIGVNANLPGKSLFTGTGISAKGLFDPKVAGPGTYTINYLFTVDGTGCTYSTSFVVKVNPSPVVSLPTQYTILEGEQVTLRPVANVAGGAALTYKWSPSTGLSRDNIADPVVNVTDDTRYTLTVTSENIVESSCSTVLQTEVKVLKLPVIPNAFTPNGDGINDTWDIKYLNEYPNAVVEIFNRFGVKVFYANGYARAWDGRFNGGDLPVGTYYYIISPNSGRKPVSGYVTIIR
ncbi:PKD domain-containing protein [Mucilaginibacter sp. UR6-11]|uniref:PKD domain-containing protein n=1 Tax=Mucilaginibacter sp. UR6-11 TaxID=1435644 RepID=UPI00272AC5A2|nr:PKD domain-containing protein [Mucilaginibacter sp. UR6-11]